jgi:hypothetical protein
MSNTGGGKLPKQPQVARSPASDQSTIAGRRWAAIEQYFKKGWSIAMPTIGGEWSCLGMGSVYILRPTTNPGAKIKAQPLPSLYDSVRGSLLSFERETARARGKRTGFFHWTGVLAALLFRTSARLACLALAGVWLCGQVADFVLRVSFDVLAFLTQVAAACVQVNFRFFKTELPLTLIHPGSTDIEENLDGQVFPGT